MASLVEGILHTYCAECVGAVGGRPAALSGVARTIQRPLQPTAARARSDGNARVPRLACGRMHLAHIVSPRPVTKSRRVKRNRYELVIPDVLASRADGHVTLLAHLVRSAGYKLRSTLQTLLDETTASTTTRTAAIAN